MEAGHVVDETTGQTSSGILRGADGSGRKRRKRRRGDEVDSTTETVSTAKSEEPAPVKKVV